MNFLSHTALQLLLLLPVVLLAVSCDTVQTSAPTCEPGSGDINLDGVPADVGDAVMFTHYLHGGYEVFTIDRLRQVAECDVNGDCNTPTLADLVYLVLYIVGDAKPLDELVPVVVKYVITGDTVSVRDEVVQARIVVRGEATPTFLVSDVRTAVDFCPRENVTFINLWSNVGTFSGLLASVAGDILSADFATADGAPVRVRRRTLQ